MRLTEWDLNEEATNYILVVVAFGRVSAIVGSGAVANGSGSKPAAEINGSCVGGPTLRTFRERSPLARPYFRNRSISLSTGPAGSGERCFCSLSREGRHRWPPWPLGPPYSIKAKDKAHAGHRPGLGRPSTTWTQILIHVRLQPRGYHPSTGQTSRALKFTIYIYIFSRSVPKTQSAHEWDI